MGKRNNSIIISGILVAFLVGTIVSSPSASAANPVITLINEQVISKLNQIIIDIAALTTGVSATTETQIDNIETETNKIQMVKDDIAALNTGVSTTTETQIDDIETETNKIQMVKDQIPILQHIAVDITLDPSDGNFAFVFPLPNTGDFYMGRYNLKASGISGDSTADIRCNNGPLFNHFHATIAGFDPTTELDFACKFIQIAVLDVGNGVDSPAVHIEGTIIYFKSTDQIDFTHP